MQKIKRIYGKEYKVPAQRTLEKWGNDGIVKCPDGCKVEPDGACPHGQSSWFLLLGIV